MWVLAVVSVTRPGAPGRLAAGVAIAGPDRPGDGHGTSADLFADPPAMHWVIQIVHLLIGSMARCLAQRERAMRGRQAEA